MKSLRKNSEWNAAKVLSKSMAVIAQQNMGRVRKMTEYNNFIPFISFSKQWKNTVAHVKSKQASKKSSKTTCVIQQDFEVKDI